MHGKDLLVRLSGIVKAFKGNGRKLGYPTANIDVKTDLDDGIYFGYAELGQFKNHAALIFIGTPTTVGDSDHRVEAHLLDIPDVDYYGQELSLDVRHYHRPNQTFDSVDELLVVMRDDEQAARKWFKAVH